MLSACDKLIKHLFYLAFHHLDKIRAGSDDL